MIDAGYDVDLLPVRQVYYLIRGRKKDKIKVILVHGSFFETVKSNMLISQSFEQVLKERLQNEGIKLEDDIKNLLVNIFQNKKVSAKSAMLIKRR
ncbi:MAG: hypothetical protein LBT05_12560 [Planctomycetaceae bacterium]|jgi:hypothetical protein|nr:hypothetical protein [Planctomycetaceae bacterium]